MDEKLLVSEDTDEIWIFLKFEFDKLIFPTKFGTVKF